MDENYRLTPVQTFQEATLKKSYQIRHIMEEHGVEDPNDLLSFQIMNHIFIHESIVDKMIQMVQKDRKEISNHLTQWIQHHQQEKTSFRLILMGSGILDERNESFPLDEDSFGNWIRLFCSSNHQAKCLLSCTLLLDHLDFQPNHRVDICATIQSIDQSHLWKPEKVGNSILITDYWYMLRNLSTQILDPFVTLNDHGMLSTQISKYTVLFVEEKLFQHHKMAMWTMEEEQ